MNLKTLIKSFSVPIFSFCGRLIVFLKNSLNLNLNEPSLLQLYRNEELNNSYNHFKKYFKSSVLLNDERVHHYAILEALKNDKEKNLFYLEFGVYKGHSINNFSKYLNVIYGFDSFNGLNEDWAGNIDHPKSTFSLNKIPRFNKNVKIINGLIQNTLEKFVLKHKPKINFIHIDTDTYETGKYILKTLKPFLVKNCIIIFDELHNFTGWDSGEYKALTETFKEDEYKFIAFAHNSQKAVIKIN